MRRSARAISRGRQMAQRWRGCRRVRPRRSLRRKRSTGAIRQVTALPGREALPAYSPDGRFIAFMHEDTKGALRVIEACASDPISTVAKARDLDLAPSLTRTIDSIPHWSPTSDALLHLGEFQNGKRRRRGSCICRASRGDHARARRADFLSWTPGTLTFARHDRLWRADSTDTPSPAPGRSSDDAAIYPSTSNDGSILLSLTTAFGCGRQRARSVISAGRSRNPACGAGGRHPQRAHRWKWRGGQRAQRHSDRRRPHFAHCQRRHDRHERTRHRRTRQVRDAGPDGYARPRL